MLSQQALRAPGGRGPPPGFEKREAAGGLPQQTLRALGGRGPPPGFGKPAEVLSQHALRVPGGRLAATAPQEHMASVWDLLTSHPPPAPGDEPVAAALEGRANLELPMQPPLPASGDKAAGGPSSARLASAPPRSLIFYV